MIVILWIITLTSLVLAMIQFVRNSQLEKRAYEIKDAYLNLAIKK